MTTTLYTGCLASMRPAEALAVLLDYWLDHDDPRATPLLAAARLPELRFVGFERSETCELSVWTDERFARAGAVGPAAEFVLLPGGTFRMGSPDSDERAYADEKPAHDVVVAPFLMARTPLTQAVWRSLVGNTGLNPSPSYFWGEARPVEQVSWDEAMAWHQAIGLRLPSEAEWEYACRAGSTTRYCFGDDPSGLGEYAWFRENADDQTHEVGQKRPNAFGLFDMHGNVWEWCQDAWADSYEGAPTDGSARSVGRASAYLVYRGGSWGSDVSCRSAYRLGFGPGSRDWVLGFRPSRSIA